MQGAGCLMWDAKKNYLPASITQHLAPCTLLHNLHHRLIAHIKLNQNVIKNLHLPTIINIESI